MGARQLFSYLSLSISLSFSLFLSLSLSFSLSLSLSIYLSLSLSLSLYLSLSLSLSLSLFLSCQTVVMAASAGTHCSLLGLLQSAELSLKKHRRLDRESELPDGILQHSCWEFLLNLINVFLK
jgi:hypothetical protein